MPTKVWWQSLPDRGSAGNILFITHKEHSTWKKVHILILANLDTNSWEAVVGNLEVMFPPCFRSRILTVQANIVMVSKSEDPMFNLILGIDTLVNVGTILNFEDKVVQFDQAKSSVRHLILKSSSAGRVWSLCLTLYKYFCLQRLMHLPRPALVLD